MDKVFVCLLCFFLLSSNGVESAAIENGSSEFAELIRLFMLPEKGENEEQDWTTGARGEVPIDWETSGVEMVFNEEDPKASHKERKGTVVVNLNGKAAFETLQKNLSPLSWDVVLTGDALKLSGVKRVVIEETSLVSDLPIKLSEYLSQNKINIKSANCYRYDLSSCGYSVYNIFISGKKPAWLVYEFCGGSGGFTHSFSLHYKGNLSDFAETYNSSAEMKKVSCD